jgi:hypothetical protein
VENFEGLDQQKETGVDAEPLALGIHHHQRPHEFRQKCHRKQGIHKGFLHCGIKLLNRQDVSDVHQNFQLVLDPVEYLLNLLFFVGQRLNFVVNFGPDLFQLKTKVSEVLYEWHAQEKLGSVVSPTLSEDLEGDCAHACLDQTFWVVTESKGLIV